MRRSSDAEILAVHVLHRQEAAAVGVAEVVEAADVLVRHLARDAQLVVKLREPAVVGGDAAGQELQGDRLIEREVVGAIHFAHAAASEQRDQAVAAGDDRAGREAGSASASAPSPAPIGRDRRRSADGSGTAGFYWRSRAMMTKLIATASRPRWR